MSWQRRLTNQYVPGNISKHFPPSLVTILKLGDGVAIKLIQQPVGLQSVADLAFGLWGSIFLVHSAEIFLSVPLMLLPFCMNCSPNGHCCAPPYVRFKARGMMREAYSSFNDTHSIMADKRSFPVSASLFFIVDVWFWKHYFLLSHSNTAKSVKFSHGNREICHVDRGSIEIDP